MATAKQIDGFIHEIAPIIVRVGKERGYHVVSPIIAQALTESMKSTGLSQLASKYHNYFGMKAGSNWKGEKVRLRTKEEYKQGELTTIYDNFRVYQNMEAGVNGYFDFISTKRYAALKNCTTPQQYLNKIREAGYATSYTYVTNNMNKIRKYNLERWDNLSVEPGNNPYREPVSNMKKGMTGNSIKWIQFELNKHGYNLAEDGIFGNKTFNAVWDYQEKNNLTVDGIVGPQTRNSLKGGNK